MQEHDQPESVTDSGAPEPSHRAPVPLVSAARWSEVPRSLLSRSSSTFVTHLLATAEHVPQTRSLRRATPADAKSAYTKTAYGAIRQPSPDAGLSTQRTI